MISSTPKTGFSKSNDIFVGRQPIFDSSMKTAAYELLFRSCEKNQAMVTDQEKATAELLVNSLFVLGASLSRSTDVLRT